MRTELIPKLHTIVRMPLEMKNTVRRATARIPMRCMSLIAILLIRRGVSFLMTVW